MHPVLFRFGSILIPSYGALAAMGVLAALFLAQRTAQVAGVDPAEMWNLSVTAMFSALLGERLVLIAANWSAIERHPSWTLALAMIHHPLVTSAGVLAGALAAAAYARWRRMPAGATADALAAPLALGLAWEQAGALLAGSGFGVEAGARIPWAVTYTSILAARWSGAPLGVRVHPVQAYAALGFLTLTVFLLAWGRGSEPGDLAGIGLVGIGTVVYLTELWRDPEGRGSLFHGALDAPGAAAVLMVIAGGWVLRERRPGDSKYPEADSHL